MRCATWLAAWAFALPVQCHHNTGENSKIFKRQTNTPDVDSFLRRWQTSTTILGNRLYIDGGQLSQLVSGKENWRASNATLSIPLDTSWTNETLVMTEIPKDIPYNVNVPTLWADEKNNALYSYNGDKVGSSTSHTSSRTLYRFNPDGRGSGTWAGDEAASSWGLSELRRSARSAVTTCNGKGFAFGGYGSSGTDDRFEPGTSVPLGGMVMYDFETKHWTNVSIAPLVDALSGRVPSNGHAVCLPLLGESGVVMFLAGAARPYDDGSWNPIPLGNMTFYDIKTETWHWQTTTGDVPEHRRDACATIAHGKNGTYEVFLFGGMPISSGGGINYARGDMWVLSMPGFKWFKVDSEVTPGRGFGSCASKDRQLIMTAGTAMASSDQGKLENKDPWNQGIGVFDMTALEWRSSYDHQLGDYDSPKVVQKWYSDGGAPRWDDGGMQRLFEPTASNPANPTSMPNDPASGTQSSNTGVIAGATVGGVVALAIIGALIWFLRRRKSAKQSARAELDAPAMSQPAYSSTAGSPMPAGYRSKPGTASPYSNSDSPYPYSELPSDTRSQPSELAEQARSSELPVESEIGAPQYVHEMYGDDIQQGNHAQGASYNHR